MTPTDTGDVSIPFGDTTALLTCTLGAAKRVNALYGNYVEAMRQVQAFNLDSYSGVVAAALGKSVADVEVQVYAAGMESIVKPLMKYLANLTNGGKPIVKAEPAKDAAPGEG